LKERDMTRRKRLFPSKHPYRHRMRALIGAATFAALASCAPETALYTAAESPKTVKLDWVHFDHLVAFPRGDVTLAPAERTRLDAFLARATPDYGDQLLVGPGPVPAAMAGEAEARTEAVARVLQAHGLDARTAPPEIAQVAWDGSVRVVLGRYLVHTPDCPDWTKPADGDPLNREHSNFGCATASTLDLMVANPADLVHGRAMTAGDGDQSARLFRVYRALNQYAPPPIPSSGFLEKVPQDLAK
jgi:pilus assembly protein CpaD